MRPAHFVVVVALAALVVGVPAHRAWANTENTVKIAVGQTVTKSYSDLVGDDAEAGAYQQAGNANYTSNAQDPPDCDSMPSCDDIPLTLDLPKSALTTDNNYLLQITLTYDNGAGANTPLGTETTNTVSASLWDNPIPTKGPHANGQDGSCFTDPCVINEASPDTTTYSLVADQLTGAADAYKVTIKLTDVGGGGGNCTETASGPVCQGSQTPSAPAGGSTSPASPSEATLPGAGAGALPPAPLASSLPAPTSIGLALPSYQVQSGGPNPVLSALSSLQVGSVLGLGGKALRQGTFLGIPAARPASSLAVALALLTTPALLVAGYVLLTLRRRRIGL